MSYSTPCVRQNCTIDKTLEDVNHGQFQYRTNIAANLRGNATCNGSGPGAGVLCSMYTQGPARRTVAGEPGMNVLFHRSDISSACAPSDITEFPDTLDEPVYTTPEQRLFLNKGFGLNSYRTRSFMDNSQLLESNIVAQYMDKPNRVGRGFQGWFPIEGMNQQTRTLGLCEENARFRIYKNTGPSARSYGSYGVAW